MDHQGTWAADCTCAVQSRDMPDLLYWLHEEAMGSMLSLYLEECCTTTDHAGRAECRPIYVKSEHLPMLPQMAT